MIIERWTQRNGRLKYLRPAGLSSREAQLHHEWILSIWNDKICSWDSVEDVRCHSFLALDVNKYNNAKIRCSGRIHTRSNLSSKSKKTLRHTRNHDPDRLCLSGVKDHLLGWDTGLWLQMATASMASAMVSNSNIPDELLSADKIRQHQNHRLAKTQRQKMNSILGYRHLEVNILMLIGGLTSLSEKTTFSSSSFMPNGVLKKCSLLHGWEMRFLDAASGFMNRLFLELRYSLNDGVPSGSSNGFTTSFK